MELRRGEEKRRSNKVIDGKLYVKHGRLGKWVDAEQHLKDDHESTYER